MAWTIDFKSRTNEDYHIEIEGGYGALTPSDNPFYTQEEGDDNLFVPVKIQTGYIRILTDNINLLRSIIPGEGGQRKVTATNGDGDIVWLGYVQPKMLDTSLWRGLQEVGIPIECPLSALKYQKYTNTTNSTSFADMLSSLLRPTFYQFYFQGSAINAIEGDSEYYQRTWLQKRVHPYFFQKKDMTNADVLKAVCTFFGWTCRCQGRNVYFTQFRNVDAVGSTQVLSVEDDELVNGIVQRYDWTEQDIPTTASADARTTLAFTEGVREARVSCALEAYDTEFRLPDEEVVRAIYEGDFAPRYIDTSYDEGTVHISRGYNESFDGLVLGDWVASGFNVWTSLNKHDSQNMAKWTYAINIANSAWLQDFDPQDSLQLMHIVGWYSGWFRLHRTEAYTFTIGNLHVNVAPGQFKGVLFARVKIGDKYFNADKWDWDSQYGTEKELQVDAETNELVVPITEEMTGELEIEFYLHGVGGTDMSGLSITFESKALADFNLNQKEISHTATSGTNFSQYVHLSTDLCVREYLMLNSMNCILEPDGTPCDGLYNNMFDTVKFNPLQRIADEIAKEGEQLGEYVKYSVLPEAFAKPITPLTILYLEDLDAMVYPVSISRNWRDEVLELKLLRRRYSNQ